MPSRHEIPVARSEDETVVAVHHEAAPEPKGWLVCCHGFLSDKSGSYEDRCERAVEEGYHGVRFDFRGCGESDGAFRDATLSSRITDLNAVLDYFGPDLCVLFGSSFGGKVAFHTAEDDRVEAVAARAPVTYGARAFEEVREAVERTGECRFEVDRRIDERFFEDLDEYGFGDVLLQTFDGEDHRFSRGAERRLREQLFDWLAVV